MRVYLKHNVYEKALERISFLFDEFEEVIASFSGGKDSTVILNLALKVAKEKGRLPLKVLFLDQEAEWDATIDYTRLVMGMEEVEPLWLQMPFKIFNGTSHDESWLICWEVGKKWLRKKEEISLKENVYGTDRFKEMFSRFLSYHYEGKKVCYLTGVRAEESPARALSLTGHLTYKDITWGKKLCKKGFHFTFCPIYDWGYRDVWKAINDNSWAYCKIYDYMYRYGVPINNMRVSNLNHETAVRSLFFMQEIEKENFERLVKRLSGINTAKHLKESAFKVEKLPYMFESWREYRDYLKEKLVKDTYAAKRFDAHFRNGDKVYLDDLIKEKWCRVCITAILKNDYHSTTLENFHSSPAVGFYRQVKSGKRKPQDARKTFMLKYLQ